MFGYIKTERFSRKMNCLPAALRREGVKALGRFCGSVVLQVNVTLGLHDCKTA